MTPSRHVVGLADIPVVPSLFPEGAPIERARRPSDPSAATRSVEVHANHAAKAGGAGRAPGEVIG